MKNVLIFLLGVAVGAGGCMLWLRKDIKKELNEMKNEGSEEAKNGGSEADLPFEMAENGASEGEEKAENEVKTTERIAYNKIIEQVISTENEENSMMTETEEGYFPEDFEPGMEPYEIDREEFLSNNSDQKVRLVYFRGDRIMATEAGSVIHNPAIMVGIQWENWVGKYAPNTAFVKNPKLFELYEIYVEDGLYVDEYGPLDGYRED